MAYRSDICLGWLVCSVICLSFVNVCRSEELQNATPAVRDLGKNSTNETETCTCGYDLRNLVDDWTSNVTEQMSQLCLNSSASKGDLLACVASSREMCQPEITQEIQSDLHALCVKDCPSYETIESEVGHCWDSITRAVETKTTGNYETFCSIWSEGERCTTTATKNCSMAPTVIDRFLTTAGAFTQLNQSAAAICSSECADYLRNYTQCRDLLELVKSSPDPSPENCSGRDAVCSFAKQADDRCPGVYTVMKLDELVENFAAFSERCTALEKETTSIGYKLELENSQHEDEEHYNSTEIEFERNATMVETNATYKAEIEAEQDKNPTKQQTHASNETQLELIQATAMITTSDEATYESSETMTEQYRSTEAQLTSTSETVATETSTRMTTPPSTRMTTPPSTRFPSSSTADNSGQNPTKRPVVKITPRPSEDRWRPCGSQEGKTGSSYNAASHLTSCLASRLTAIVLLLVVTVYTSSD